MTWHRCDTHMTHMCSMCSDLAGLVASSFRFTLKSLREFCESFMRVCKLLPLFHQLLCLEMRWTDVMRCQVDKIFVALAVVILLHQQLRAALRITYSMIGVTSAGEVA